jgi:hypothetical protein
MPELECNLLIRRPAIGYNGLRRDKSSICRWPVTLPCDSLDAVGATRDRHAMPVAWQTTWMINGTASILLIVAISWQNFLTRLVVATSTFYFHKPAAVF